MNRNIHTLFFAKSASAANKKNVEMHLINKNNMFGLQLE